jgi:hypothetical protein
LPSDQDAVKNGTMDASLVLGTFLATLDIQDWSLFNAGG